ncbi:hypothetical protein RIF29_31298 [Crotalaria pallida]|uniref:Uncharacterized protein n=1 Tax=Crotalaria pallida TaxID=3830 RepID=A0AAN9EH21_CROPI
MFFFSSISSSSIGDFIIFSIPVATVPPLNGSKAAAVAAVARAGVSAAVQVVVAATRVVVTATATVQAIVVASVRVCCLLLLLFGFGLSSLLYLLYCVVLLHLLYL